MLTASQKILSLFTLLTFPFFIKGMEDLKKMRELLTVFMEMSVKQEAPTCEQIRIEMGAQAAAKGDLESLKHFIDSSNVNKLTHDGIRPFQHAIIFAYNCQDETKYRPIFDYLFSQNAEIQKKVAREKTSPIAFTTSIACYEGYIRPLEILLETKGKPFESISDDGPCPATIAVIATTEKDKGRYASLVLKLFQSKASSLYQAVQCLDVEKVKEFASSDSISSSEKCPLALSSEHWVHGIPQGLTILEILLSQGGTPIQQLKGELPGITLLTHATRHALHTGDVKLLELCLAKGGNPKHKTFPMAPSAIEMVKTILLVEPTNPHISKVRALLNTNA